MRIAFDNSYGRLPARFYERIRPVSVRSPELICLNQSLADGLGLADGLLSGTQGAEILSGNRVASGSDPLAMAYAGHQFGHFVSQLGDGRAVLLGEVIDAGGIRRDIQLKGSGRTSFSRGGDGRAALGPVMREYMLAEAMHSLGIATTRALAMVTTGESVRRETALPGAILTRVASSCVRVGTFEYFAARDDREGLKTLADYVIDRHYPSLRDIENPYHGLLDAVIEAQARLVASWLHVGFIHGVMNTDNMAVSGETIDYGPCAFMDNYDSGCVFSSIDHYGRYAYGNQGRIAQWNASVLGWCLLPLLDPDESKARALANDSVEAFADIFDGYWLDGYGRKLGLRCAEDSDGRARDRALIDDLLERMQNDRADYTVTFRALCDAVDDAEAPFLSGMFTDDRAHRAWMQDWHRRLGSEGDPPSLIAARMRGHNPAFIPRNHRIEEAIAAGVAGDFSVMARLMTVLADPYDDQPENAAYAPPPTPAERVCQTFCGT